MKSKLSGDRCRCGSCGLYFTSTKNFEAHRRGAPDARRCLTADDLLSRGYGPNAAGFWRRPKDGSLKSRRHIPCLS